MRSISKRSCAPDVLHQADSSAVVSSGKSIKFRDEVTKNPLCDFRDFSEEARLPGSRAPQSNHHGLILLNEDKIER
jgi:hypothetical protein